jgi:hypothetical protein
MSYGTGASVVYVRDRPAGSCDNIVSVIGKPQRRLARCVVC